VSGRGQNGDADNKDFPRKYGAVILLVWVKHMPGGDIYRCLVKLYFETDVTVQNPSLCASRPEGRDSRATVAEASNPNVKGDIRESKLQNSIWLSFFPHEGHRQKLEYLSLAGYLTMLCELHSYLSVECG
jgi:hypothetical protein